MQLSAKTINRIAVQCSSGSTTRPLILPPVTPADMRADLALVADPAAPALPSLRRAIENRSEPALPLIAKSSRALPASAEVLAIPELCATIIDHLDNPRDKVRLFEVSHLWQTRVARTDAYLLRLAQVLDIPPRRLRRLDLAVPPRELVLTLSRMVHRLTNNRGPLHEEGPGEELVRSVVERTRSAALVLAVQRVEFAKRSQREALMWKMKGAGLLAGGAALGIGGAWVGIRLYGMGYCETAGYAFDAAARRYIRTREPSFYEPSFSIPGSDYATTPETPEDRRNLVFALTVPLGLTMGVAGAEYWVEGAQRSAEARVIKQALQYRFRP